MGNKLDNKYIILAIPIEDGIFSLERAIFIRDDSDNQPKALYSDEDVEQRLEDLALSGGYIHVAIPYALHHWLEDGTWIKRHDDMNYTVIR